MCSEKIKKKLNNDPDLIEKFGKSLELDKKSYFKVKTDKNKIIKLPPKELRIIIISNVPIKNLNKGNITQKEAIEALDNWDIVVDE